MLRSAAQMGAAFHILSSEMHDFPLPHDITGPSSGERKPRKASPAKKAKRAAQRKARMRTRKSNK